MAGIVNKVCSMPELKDAAIAAANTLAGKEGLDREILSKLKRDLYKDIVRILSQPARLYSHL